MPDVKAMVVFRSAAPLLATGVLAGGALYLGMRLGPRVSGHGGEVGSAIAFAGLVLCVGLLACGWKGLAPGRAVVVAAAVTGVLFIPAVILFTVAVAATPVDSVFCSDPAADYLCGIGVLFLIPVYGAVVPWTVAGLAGVALLSAARRGQ